MRVARARAHANIALVKYWGKRDGALNVPAAPSLSLTLEALQTTTEVSFDGDRDRLILGGVEIEGPPLARLSAWLDVVRQRAGISSPARVESENNFPTASGLASSASAYAALAIAASAAAGLELAPRELSILARRGSGSAARSIFGGFVSMRAGGDAESFAEPVPGSGDFAARLAMVVAVVGGGAPKAISSREAMQRCAATSPLYGGWLDSVPGDMAEARRAVDAADLEALGAVAEASCLAMHGAAMASRPGIVYFGPTTLALVDRVRKLRAGGLPVYFTIDAGPHVKALTRAEDAAAVAAELAAVDGVTGTLVSRAGPAARRLDR